MKRWNKSTCGGFTLVEVIVVMVILSILAAAIIPSYHGYIDKAKEERYIAEARAVEDGIQSYLVEEYAAGTLRGSKIRKNLMKYELGHPDNALTELLKGSYTPGANIIYMDVVISTGEYSGMIYEVDGYSIKFIPGKKTVVTKN